MSRDVLIVHGHRMCREALCAIVSGRAGLRVVAEASDGWSAVQLATRFRPNVVVIESTLKGLDCVRATRRIVDAVAGVRVIVLARSEGALGARRMIRAGAFAYLSKDAGTSDLFKAIDAARSGEVYVDSSLEDAILEIPLGDRARHDLTERQCEVLQLLTAGQSTREIADSLGVSAKTVEAHRKHIMDKLKLYTVAELTKYAIREGLTSADA
jgi:DNA-binding NarL/FixJ family response regulator